MRKHIFLALWLCAQTTQAGILPFSLPWMNHSEPNTEFNSVDYPKAVFVLEVYGLNCRYCNDNVPNVKALVEKYKDEKRVKVIDVGTDRFDSYYKRWIARHKPSYPVIKDDKLTIYKQLGTDGIPTTAIVDCLGNIQYVTAGVWSDEIVANLHKAIDTSLGLEECQ